MITTKIILNQTVYGQASGNYDGSSQDFLSDSVQAADYYRGRGGIQTITFDVTGFEGIIYLDATLDTVPETATWFNTFTFGDGSTTPVTDRHPESVIGNLVWMRVRVSGFSGGTINSITINY